MTTTSTPVESERPDRPLRHRNFRFLVIGSATSTLGNSITPVALAFAVLDLGGSATDLGLVVAAFALADVVTVLFGGVLGDRVPRQLMMEGSAAACVLTQGVVAVLLIGGWATIPVLGAVGVLNGCLGALSQPSSSAMTRMTVPNGLVAKAVAMRGVLQTSAGVVGFALGSVLFIQRMSKTTAIATHTPFVGRDEADSARPRGSYDEDVAANPEVVVYRITGALFFGATASIGSVLDRIQDSHKALIVDFSAVPFLDSTGANMIEGLAHKAHKRGVALWLTGASRDIQRVFVTHGLKRPLVHYAASFDEALEAITDASGNAREVA